MIDEGILKKLSNIEQLLKEQNLLQKNILSLDEAAIYMNLSSSALYKLTSASKITYSKPTGKCIYFKREDIDRFLAGNTYVSNSDIETQIASFKIGNVSKSNKNYGG
ncbi:helix-turn-helix domain-containing protein [Pedobacter sp. SYSU D00535]|uniref:helix-turn-helix domain-containing protein n=1 Tax=Pedobacter sp. SYSU D00535 TaxID=2810308 RepID=UPI001A97C4D2